MSTLEISKHSDVPATLMAEIDKTGVDDWRDWRDKHKNDEQDWRGR